MRQKKESRNEKKRRAYIKEREVKQRKIKEKGKTIKFKKG